MLRSSHITLSMGSYNEPRNRTLTSATDLTAANTADDEPMAALLWVAQLETYFILGHLNYLFTTDEQHPVMDTSHPPAPFRSCGVL